MNISITTSVKKSEGGIKTTIHLFFSRSLSFLSFYIQSITITSSFSVHGCLPQSRGIIASIGIKDILDH